VYVRLGGGEATRELTLDSGGVLRPALPGIDDVGGVRGRVLAEDNDLAATVSSHCVGEANTHTESQRRACRHESRKLQLLYSSLELASSVTDLGDCQMPAFARTATQTWSRVSCK
jgi:hypothetical protein